MQRTKLIAFALMLAQAASIVFAAESSRPDGGSPAGTNNVRREYVLVPTDVIQVKVYQEDDLDAKVRISKDGTVTLPLLGLVRVAGKTRAQAANLVQQMLGDKYLVNPQVSVDVVEYSKRRFTVMGQVQRPGTYEIPGDESINLLQAISMAGGYTRLGAANKVTVQRGEGEQRRIFKLDADSMAKEKGVNMFEVMADDTITIGEKIF
jgi:protein involved in polysaccharide export with SLBB domain